MFAHVIRGDLRRYAAGVEKAGPAAFANVIRRRGRALLTALRREIVAAGLGERLANAVRLQVWPERGGSLSAKARVFSKAIYKRPGGFADLLTVFDEGAAIQGSPYLAIPLVALQSPKDGRRQARPDDYPEGTFGVRPTRRQGVLVLYWKSRPDDEAFVLFRSTTIRRRLQLQAIAARFVNADVDRDLLAEWDRQIAAFARKAA